MPRDIPISQVRPTHSSSKLVKFTNIDKEDFIHALGGKRYKFKKEKSVMLPESYACHFAKNLAYKIVFRDDDSLLKYAKIDEKLNRERTMRGETPIIKGVTKEVVDNLIYTILNGHRIAKVEDTEAPIDAEEIGMAVPDKPKKEKSKKSRKGKAVKEEVEEDFEDLGDLE